MSSTSEDSEEEKLNKMMSNSMYSRTNCGQRAIRNGLLDPSRLLTGNVKGFGEAGPLLDITRELGPESFDGNASFMHLSRDKSVEEVVNILKRHGFFKESLKIDNAADFRNLNSGPEIVIEMYKP